MEASSAADHELASRFAAVLRHIWCTQGSGDLRAIEEHGLSVTQVKVLFSLGNVDRSEPMGVHEIAELLGISVPSASRAVDGLVRGGHVDRAEDPDDRRVRRISLTDAGADLLEQLALARVAGLERYIATLSADQRSKLDLALAAIAERPEIGARG
jgi:DNA-binding MarR family transcriptional regulator